MRFRGVGGAEQHVAQSLVARAGLGLHHHEQIADRRAGDEQPGCPQERKRAHLLAMAHRDLGGDPPADRGAGQVEIGQPERIDDLQIVEDEIVHGLGQVILGAVAAPRVCGCDDTEFLPEAMVERQPIRPRAMNVGEPVQVE